MDPLESRFRKQQAAAAERAARLRRCLPEAARLLARRGASRLWLFGSLAGGPVHGESDVDLLVEGVAEADRTTAWWDLEGLLGTSVDLVRYESAPAGLRQIAEQTGECLSHLLVQEPSDVSG